MKRCIGLATAGIFVLLLALPVSSQEEEAVLPEIVQLEASSGVTYVGDFYLPAVDVRAGERLATVLMFHQSGSDRSHLRSLALALLDAGYAVLAVDSPGMGDSGGMWESDADAIVENCRDWFEWLREQPEVRADAIATLGSSVGAIQSILGCADDSSCVTAIALSPPSEIYGVSAEEMNAVIGEQLRRRSILLLAAVQDRHYAAGVRDIVGWSRGEVGVRIFPGLAHGETLFTTSKDSEQVVALIIEWLNEHMPPAG